MTAKWLILIVLASNVVHAAEGNNLEDYGSVFIAGGAVTAGPESILVESGETGNSLTLGAGYGHKFLHWLFLKSEAYLSQVKGNNKAWFVGLGPDFRILQGLHVAYLFGLGNYSGQKVPLLGTFVGSDAVTGFSIGVLIYYDFFVNERFSFAPFFGGGRIGTGHSPAVGVFRYGVEFKYWF